MKKEFKFPEVDFIEFRTEDAITTSGLFEAVGNYIKNEWTVVS